MATSGSANSLSRNDPANLRIYRTLCAAIAVGGTIFTLLAVPAALSQHAALHPWFSIAAIVSLGSGPVLLGVLANWAPIGALRLVCLASIVAMILVLLGWASEMNARSMPGAASPWPLSVIAVSTAMSALVLPRAGAWAFTIAASVGAGVLRFAVQGTDDPTIAIQDTMYMVLACSVFVSLVQVTVRLSGQRDRAAAEARKEAARAATMSTKERETLRFNSLVHDDVISTLLAAGLSEVTDDLIRRRAHTTLVKLSALTIGENETETFNAEEMVSLLRSSVTDQASGIVFTVTVAGALEVPVGVASAIDQALGEAVRNSLRHATRNEGTLPTSRTVALAITEYGIAVDVRDDGPGFAIEHVGEERLGIAVSIHGTMVAVNGGSAKISSGSQGTTVALRWRRP
jgi:signal transduction histidine kinase